MGISVFKFGGASVKDCPAFENVVKIIREFGSPTNQLVVVSAIGKTTNALEQVWLSATKGLSWKEDLDEIKSNHFELLEGLFPKDAEIVGVLHSLFDQLESRLVAYSGSDKHEFYDSVVSHGELFSSTILERYLAYHGMNTEYLDSRSYIITNSDWRDAMVDWNLTKRLILAELPDKLQKGIVVTQGFLGGTVHNRPTTLGREGSDYSAAIYASCLHAEWLTIWKDVPGILNADPRMVPDTVLIDRLSYQQAAEMTYYGASVIHPKTIKPLAQKGVALYVRSFLNPSQPGTCISTQRSEADFETVIFKKNQALICIEMTDISNMSRFHLHEIIKYLNMLGVDLNFISMSAISLSVLINSIEENIELIERMRSDDYVIKIARELELITIINPRADSASKYATGREVVLDYSESNRRQLVIRAIANDQPNL